MDVPGEGDIRRFLIERLGEHVDPDRPLGEYGLSSREAVAIAGELAELLGRELSPTLVWEHPTVNRLAQVLSGAEPPIRAAPAPGEPVAVVGLGCRFPGAHGPEEYWDLLAEGRDAVGEVPAGRWEAFDDGSARTGAVLAGTTRHGGFLADVAGFDAEFFGIAPREAAAMDPQQRLLLETAWEALEHGGIAPRSLGGTRTGVFAGISGTEYAYLTGSDLASVDAWTATGGALSIAANRLSYLLDLRGPSMAVDTACSSSLVATHLAVSSLRAGECDLALAAGVNVLLTPVVTVAFDRGGGTAPDGRCKAFDAAADGMVRAEGCGVVVLKRLADAVRDGDRVLALIGATAVNQDGRSNGLVAPNPEAQEALLRHVYADRGPDYIEAHGTGTFLGDPIEARAIAAAVPGPVLLGSVKTNLGHLEAAAGIAGLIKTVLALHHGVIPPSLHFRAPNPHIPWDTLEVVTRPRPWPRADARAGVSAFGFGGTNAHVVVDAYGVAAPAPPPATGKHLFLLTDTTPDRVRDHARALATWRPAGSLADVAHTLARRAGRGRVAGAVAAGSAAELAERLQAIRPATTSAFTGPVWVFGGYTAKCPDFALYDTEPAYRHTLDTLAPLLAAEAGIDVHDPDAQGVATLQPLIFAAQLALANLWRAYGFEPAAVIGHSMGEVAAAVVAGGLTVPDAVKVICTRSRLLGGLGGGGAMAVVGVAASEVPEDLHVAVYSAPGQCVVTGDPGRVAAFAAEVAARGAFARTLTAEGAGHSPQVAPLVPVLRDELAAVPGGKPEVPYYSVVFDDPREEPVFEAAYWAAGVRRPVRLMQAVQAAAEDGHTLFTELSPRPVLTGALRDTLPATALVTTGDFHTQLETAATAITPRTRGRVVDVPRSPWQHERHWVAAPPRRALESHVETPAGHAWSLTAEGQQPVLRVAALAELIRSVLGERDLYDVTLHAFLPLPAQVSITLSGTAVEVSAKDAAGVWHRYGTAALAPAPGTSAPGAQGLERIRHVAVNGAFSGAETAGPPPESLPTRLDAKLVVRTWTPAPPREAGSPRAWLILADEGDARAARLQSLVGTPGPAAAAPVLVLPPRGLDPAGVRRIMLRVAVLAAQGRRIVVATERAQAVRGGEPPDPGPAALRGLVRVLALEHPEARARLVDFENLGDLAGELALDAAEDEVAWRGGVRYAATLQRPPLPPVAHPAPVASPGALAHPAPVVRPGAYVITGGHGRLGRIAARWLASRGATRIVLNGRSEAPAAQLGRVVGGSAGEEGRAVSGPGGRVVGGPDAEVAQVAGDLAVAGTAERLVAVATAGGERLRGVIHAAGVLDDRLIADLDAGSLERVWAAKVDGGLRLHEATKDLDLDWWVAFSSAAGLLGSPGQAAYAAANAWLDAFCEWRRSEGLPGLSIAWGPWAGTATALPAVHPLTRDEGVEALEALIQRNLSAGVAKVDVEQAVTIFPAITRIPYFAAFAGPSAASDPSPDGVFAKVRQRASAILGVETDRLRADTVLTDLGLDSLAATRLRGTIEHDFGVTLPAAPLLNGATLGELTAAITAPHTSPPGDAAHPGPSGAVEPPGATGGVARPGPRDAAERQVVRVLAELIGHEPSVTDQVPPPTLPEALTRLSQELATPLPQDLGAVSVADLADLVRTADEAQADGQTVIRPLNATPAGHPLNANATGRPLDATPTGRPLFLAHPAGGTTGVYGLLARRLPAPVLGLERLDEDGGIPERAARYAELIRNTCAPPYRLGGWSFGGILAFEIAHHLSPDTELVAMIDSGLPEPLPPDARRRAEARRYRDFATYLTETYGIRIDLDEAELLELDGDAQTALVRERMTAAGALDVLPAPILRHQLTSHEDTRAIERYRPARYEGRVVLYRSTEPTPWAVHDSRYAHEGDPSRGFGPYCADLEIVEVPGSHHLNLLDPPHFEVIAEHLKGSL